MPPVGFEPTIPARERPQTYALDRAATGIGLVNFLSVIPLNVFRRVLRIMISNFNKDLTDVTTMSVLGYWRFP